MSVTLSAGDEIGRFRIEERVGRGGMGVVYRAFDPQLERPVALKLLAPHLGEDEAALARFHREAALIAKLKHNHIAVIYDYGQHEEQPYIAMEWVEGQTLKQLLAQEEKLPLERALGLLDQLAAGLDYAHKQGIVHRDLKPANIIIGPDDEATIVDFGLAWIENAATLTASHTIVGTPRYMSPEQIRGHDLDGRSDQYSLAIIFYEMVSGELPFDGDQPSVLFHQQISAPPPPIGKKDRRLAGVVENALDRALAKEPNQRFETVSEFREALSGEIRVESRRRRAWRQKRPKWFIRWLLLPLLFALLLTGLFFLVPIMRDQLSLAIGDETAVLDPETGEPLPDLSQEPDPHEAWLGAGGDAQQRRLAYPFDTFAKLEEARWAIELDAPASVGLVGDSGTLATVADSALYLIDWTTGEWNQPVPLGEDVQTSLTIFAAWEDESQVFVPTADGSLYSLDIITGTLRWRLGASAFDGLISGATANEEDDLFVTTEAGSLYRVDLLDLGEEEVSDVGQAERLWSSELFLPFAPTVVPSGVVLVGEDAETDSGMLLTVAGTTGELVWEQPLAALPSVPPMAVGDGGLLVVGQADGRLSAHTLLTGDAQWEVSLGSEIVGLATDDVWIYVQMANNVLHALAAETGEFVWERPFRPEVSFTTAPVTDAYTVAVGMENGSVYFVDAETGAWLEEQTLFVSAAPIQSLAPIGGWLFVSSEELIAAFAPAE